MIKKLTTKSIFVLSVFIFFIGALAVFARDETGRMITVEGELTCLPHRGTSDGVTMECALGLYGKNGNYYSLENLNQDDFVSGRLRTGQVVRVTGMLFVLDLSGPYDVVGAIVVRSLVHLGVVEREKNPSPPGMRNGNVEDGSPGESLHPTVLQRRAEFQRRMEEHRDMLRSRAEEAKQRVMDRRDDLRMRWEERKAKLSERRKQIIKNYIEHIIQRMRSAIGRLDAVADKLVERIAILSDGGADMTDANANLEDARTAIARAETLLQGAADSLRLAPDAENPADAIGAVRSKFEDIKAAIREAHAALVEITTSLKGRSSIAPGTGTTTDADEGE